MGAGPYIGKKAISMPCFVLVNIGATHCCIDPNLLADPLVDVKLACDITSRMRSANEYDAWTLIAEYSNVVSVGPGTDNTATEANVLETLTTDGSVVLPAHSSSDVGTDEPNRVKKPACTKEIACAEDGDKRVEPKLHNGPLSDPITDPNYLVTDLSN